jgi:protein TonB
LPDPVKVHNRCARLVPKGPPVVEARLLGDGTVGDVRITRTSGCAAADKLLVEAMRSWKFKPALQAGKPVDIWLTMVVNHYWW